MLFFTSHCQEGNSRLCMTFPRGQPSGEQQAHQARLGAQPPRSTWLPSSSVTVTWAVQFSATSVGLE